MKKYKDQIHIEIKQEIRSKMDELKSRYGITGQELTEIINELAEDIHKNNTHSKIT